MLRLAESHFRLAPKRLSSAPVEASEQSQKEFVAEVSLIEQVTAALDAGLSPDDVRVAVESGITSNGLDRERAEQTV